LGNIHADSILRNLRKPGDTEYKIPYGGIFNYVSAGNYFCGTVEWVGFAIACWNLPVMAFAMFTISNLMPRALTHHEWYQKKFDNYPKNRKAYIPFIL
jgi:3-oxo-5-alpha-steroid 4-dehydrogenase 1